MKNIIIDYHAGNLFNLKNALDYLGLSSEIVTDPGSVQKADRILLPGVGAFAPAMEKLRASSMLEAIQERISGGTPFLGICVGAQLLFEQGEEKGVHKGIGILPGKVERFQHDLKIPQIGWNQVKQKARDLLFQDVPDKSYFYFVHSYHMTPVSEKISLGTTEYVYEFSSVVRKDNVWGVQFHPEKSQNAGLQLLKNFCTLT